MKTAALIPLFCLLPAGPVPAREPLALVELGVGNVHITAEVANTQAARSAGLMHRNSLPDNRGMVFVHPAGGRLCMWMKDTPLPLSVAFIDASGRILNIADMQPYTLDRHCSVAPAQYALEMNRGWFGRNHVASGDTVRGLASLHAEE